ncbi:B-cell receptor CD22 [Osmerus mordax]|uniref:B-cell receptor CD22 n=1 Tax=Osmerus mordax TaxID=8014 RepID=UPI00351054E5
MDKHRSVQTSASSWTAEVPSPVSALLGSCVVIPCSFNYPEPEKKSSEVTGIWAPKNFEKIYHPDRCTVLQDYKDRTQLVGDLQVKNCSLRIDPLHQSDTGPFHFRIEVKDSFKYSYVDNTVSIDIKVLPEPPTLSVSEEVRVGELFTASCSVSHSCPTDPPVLTWSHSATPTVQSQQLPKGQWEVTSSLTFAPTVADHNKSLSCRAAYRGGKKAESYRTLNVKYAPLDVRVERESTLQEGDSVELRCSSDGNPAAHSYQWHSPSGALLSQGQTYRLERVSRHTGALYCTAINTEGQGPSSQVQLDVIYPPEIKVGSACFSNISTVTCLCIVESVPLSDVRWFLPDGVLSSTKVDRHQSVIIATLQGSLGFADYTLCHANNSEGNTTQAFKLPKKDTTRTVHVSKAFLFLVPVLFMSAWRLTRKCRKSHDGCMQPQHATTTRDIAMANGRCDSYETVQTSASSWTAEVPSQVSALLGSCVVIPCSFNYPEPEKKSSEVTGIWAEKTLEKIYHPDRSSVLQDYKERTQLVGDLQVKNCSLRIDPLHQSDTGPFHFRVEIKDYEKYSYVDNTVSIDIKRLPEPPTLSVSEEVRVGELFTASCSVSHSCPTDPPVLTWSHSATPTVQSQQLSKGQWEVTSSLTFAPTVADHKKSLRCRAAYRGGKKAESSRTLNVKYAPLDVRVERESTLQEGDSVELRCSSDGNPAAHSYQWHSPSGALLSQGQTYRLERVSRHTGPLYCTAINTEGQGRSSQVKLNVIYPPEIKVGSACFSNISTVTCLCIVESVPLSDVRWFLPDGVLSSTKVDRHQSVIIATLQGSLGFADYTLCHANNSEGNTTQAFKLPKKDMTWTVQGSIAVSAFLVPVLFMSAWRLTRKCRKSHDGQHATTTQDIAMVTAKATVSDDSAAIQENINNGVPGNQYVYGNMEADGRCDSYENVMCEDIYANV